MIVLSLFDGISCGRMALERAGMSVDIYMASEIDKYAIAVATKNYPDSIQLGDIRIVRKMIEDGVIGHVDLLIGGSPCQGFSFAGKQLAFNDPRSSLFFEYVKILNLLREKNPKIKFLLENVRMKKEYLQIISQFLGVTPILINSALVSAQNRNRYYWYNWKVEQPEDKGINLKDVVHENVDTNSSSCCNNKSYVLTASYNGAVARNSFQKKQRTILFAKLQKYIVPFDKTLKILDKEVEKGKVGYFRKDSQANRVYYIHGKAITLCGEAGGGAAKMGQYLFGCITPDRIEKRQNGQRFKTDNKFYTLTAQDQHGILTEGYIRKLTPVECERLQTLPDDYTELGVYSHYQEMYKGNECNIKGFIKCKEYVSSKVVINLSQVKKLNSAINIILDSLDMVLLKKQENLSIKAVSVSSKVVKIIVKLSKVIVSSIINNGKEINPVIKIKNVRFAVKMLDREVEECALSTMNRTGKTAILYSLKRENLNPMETQEENTLKQKTVDGFIKLLQKKYSEENCEKVKLFIMLTLTNLIITKAISMYVKATEITYVCIDSSNLLRENSLEMVLSSLKMESIEKISNSNRYKMLGNGWTVDVIAHLFRSIAR